MENKPQKSKHIVNIIDRKKLSFTGIEDVVTSDSSVIASKISDMLLVVRGEQLQIKKFDTKNGDLEIEGTFFSLEYVEKRERKGLFGKLFA